MHCRYCNTPLHNVFVDLFHSPPSNSYLSESGLGMAEVAYPLKVYTCHNCFLVQIDEFKKATDIFSSDYAYFSSYSSSWLLHSEQYVDMMCERFEFNHSSLVVEIAANDGYLLQYFQKKEIPVLGIEPTSNTAAVARSKGIEMLEEYFGEEMAKGHFSKHGADLIIGNNVLAHVPDIIDFVRGLKIALGANGIITMEFPHLMQLVDNNQFDTIYHEHFSYLSFHTVKAIFESCDLSMFDVDEISTHGGSLRIFAKHANDDTHMISESVAELLNKEKAAGMRDMSYYSGLSDKARQIKLAVLSFLVKAKSEGKKVVAYGAAAKGNTLLNYCGIKSDLIDFVVDASPHKQGMFLPGSHIPIADEIRLREYRPDYIFILPWNIKDEIKDQLGYCQQEFGAKFVTAIPKLTID